MSKKTTTLLYAIFIIAAIGLSVYISGCSGVQLTPNLAVPKCDAVEAHLVDVGCFQNDMCAGIVQDIVEAQITSRIPENVDFGAYCDIALMTGFLPIDCVMDATTATGVLDCAKEFLGI